jgi:hypothetical protein
VIRLYIGIVIVGLVGGAIGGAWYYVTSTQERIETLIANDVKLRMAKQVLDNTINTLVADQKKFAKLNTNLRANLDKANDYKDVLIGKLRKHDLSRLSLKKPLLVEARILSGATPPAK